jgi:PKD repeat protein
LYHPRATILIILLAALFSLPTPPPAQSLTQTTVGLGVFIESYPSANIVDPSINPSLPVTAKLNLTVTASNLPAITSPSAGGLQGFDISLSYDPTIFKVLDDPFSAPFCSSDNNCLYANTTQSNTIVLNNTIDSGKGIVRLAMVVIDPGLRAQGSGILFKVRLQAIGRAYRQFTIMPSSQLYGYSNNCGSLLEYAPSSASIDNRNPFQLTVDPPSLMVSAPGQKNSAKVTVARVNSAADGYVTLLLSGWTLRGARYNFTPRTGLLDGASGILNFNSTMWIFTTSITPAGTYSPEIIAQLNSTLDQSFQTRLHYIVTVGTGYVSTQAPIVSPAPSAAQATPVTAIQSPAGGSLPLLASFTSTTPAVGVPVSFTPTVCGGASPYRIRWRFGDGSSNGTIFDTPGIGAPVSHGYTSPGQYSVSLNVTDSAGRTYTASHTISVTGIAPSSPPSRPSPNALEVGLLVGILGVILLVTSLYLFRGRRRRG